MNTRQVKTASEIFALAFLALVQTGAQAAETSASEREKDRASVGESEISNLEIPAISLVGMIPAEGRLGAWMHQFRERHPRYLAQSQRARSARMLRRAAADQFYSPVLTASAGRTENPTEAPRTSFASSIDANSTYAGAGVEAPLLRGVYGGVGAYVTQDATGLSEDDSAEVGVGASLRIPLLQDRSFALHEIELQQLGFKEQERFHAMQGELLEISTDIVKQYAKWLFSVADAQEVEKALNRAEKLLEQSTERVRLKDLAQYQIYPARYEATLRREQLEMARQSIQTQAADLAQSLGLSSFPELTEESSDTLLKWAYALAKLDTEALSAISVTNASPVVLAARSAAEAAEAEVSWTAEQTRDALDLNVGAGWRSEEAADSGNEFGYTVSILYKRNLDKSGDEARLASKESEAAALRADYEEILLKAQIAREKALIEFRNSCGRLLIARSAAIAAAEALEAENDRFALGEGSSRNVLDAQQDLTSATRRHLAVAGEVIAGMAELHRVVGVMPDIGSGKE